jgi:N-acetylneuraminic acid mutarotase
MTRVTYNLATTLVAVFWIGAGSLWADEPAAKAPAEQPQWRIFADIPVPQIGCAGAVLNKKLHVIGGATIGGRASDVHQVYDPATNTWTKKAPLPDKSGWPAVTVVGGKIYVFGGCCKGINDQITDRSFVYDPEKDAWTEIAKLPRPRKGGAATEVEGSIYIYGGFEEKYAKPMVECYRYDPQTDKYARIADFPEPNAHFTSQGYFEGKIYMLYGIKFVIDSDKAQEFADGVYQYDIVHDTWIKQNVQRPLKAKWTLTQHSSHIVAGTRLIVAGGKRPGGNLRSDKAWYLDMKTKQFGELPPLPEGRCCGAGGVIDGTLYVAGGFRDERFPGGWVEPRLFKPVWALKLPSQ